MSDPRVLTTGLLKRLNDKAIAKDFNRALPNSTIKSLDPDGFHIISVFMMHEHAGGVAVEPHYRCHLLLKKRGKTDPDTAYLDVEIEAYKSLPTPEQMKAAAL